MDLGALEGGLEVVVGADDMMFELRGVRGAKGIDM